MTVKLSSMRQQKIFGSGTGYFMFLCIFRQIDVVREIRQENFKILWSFQFYMEIRQEKFNIRWSFQFYRIFFLGILVKGRIFSVFSLRIFFSILYTVLSGSSFILWTRKFMYIWQILGL